MPIPPISPPRSARRWRGKRRKAGAGGASSCAHMAACLADNGWRGRASLGLLLDGLGLGEDGALWGGEVLAGAIARRGAWRAGGGAADRRGGGHAGTVAQSSGQLRYAFGRDWRGRARPVLAHLPDPPAALAESMMASGRIVRHARRGGCSMRWRRRWACMVRASAMKGRPPWRWRRWRGLCRSGGALAAGPWRAGVARAAGRSGGGVAPGRIAARFHLRWPMLWRQWRWPGAAGQVALSGGAMQNRVLLGGCARGCVKGAGAAGPSAGARQWRPGAGAGNCGGAEGRKM
jgi:hydrogenase maturation protein HypF